jgi:hypothetical protein
MSEKEKKKKKKKHPKPNLQHVQDGTHASPHSDDLAVPLQVPKPEKQEPAYSFSSSLSIHT